MSADPPRFPVPVPAAVSAVVGYAPVRPVWVNELGGVTFRIASGRVCPFVKWAPIGVGIDLMAEVARLQWAAPFARVPRVLEHGADDQGTWFISTPIEGESAVSQRWKAEPVRAVAAIGKGLRALHEAFPIDACPFSWEAPARIAEARARARSGELDSAQWTAEHPGLRLEEALEAVADPPPVDGLVVCHGDACSPNTLLSAGGQVAGHVDLGSLGLADRWADLAIATSEHGVELRTRLGGAPARLLRHRA